MRSYVSFIECYKQGGKTNVLDSILLKAAALKSKTVIYIYDQVTANNKGLTLLSPSNLITLFTLWGQFVQDFEKILAG